MTGLCCKMDDNHPGPPCARTYRRPNEPSTKVLQAKGLLHGLRTRKLPRSAGALMKPVRGHITDVTSVWWFLVGHVVMTCNLRVAHQACEAAPWKTSLTSKPPKLNQACQVFGSRLSSVLQKLKVRLCSLEFQALLEGASDLLSRLRLGL